MKTPRHFGSQFLPLALAAASLTCSGDGGIVDPPKPGSITLVAGQGQTGHLGSAASRFACRRGGRRPGAAAWRRLGGVDGCGWRQRRPVHGLDPAATNGRAAVQRTLGTTAGEVGTTATVPDLPGVLFTSTAEAGTGPQLVVATQPSSAAKKDVLLAQQPVIRVEDGTGEPLEAGIAMTAVSRRYARGHHRPPERWIRGGQVHRSRPERSRRYLQPDLQRSRPHRGALERHYPHGARQRAGTSSSRHNRRAPRKWSIHSASSPRCASRMGRVKRSLPECP